MRNERQRTRAEAVRLRRREQSQQRTARSGEMATRPLPPITTRGGITYGTPARAATPTTRRKFQAAVSLPGIELRMPAIQITSTGMRSRLVSVALCLLLGTALYLAATLPQFHAAPAVVTGNQRISSDEINAVLNTTGQSIFLLSGSDLATRLRLNYPELEAAHVTIGLPNAVRVTVVERQPALIWLQGGGYTWIDANGIAFRPRGEAPGLVAVQAMAAPPAAGQSSSDPLSPVPFIPADLVKAAQSLATSVPAGTPLEYDPKYGLGWQDARGWKVYFGADAGDMPVKQRVYASLVDSLLQKGIQPTFISVQYPNAPYYRTTQ